MKTIHEPARDLPICREADVVVVGDRHARPVAEQVAELQAELEFQQSPYVDPATAQTTGSSRLAL